MSERVSWEEYFMNIAREVATRSTCDRKHVGAVIVRGKTILATGYNGSIRGLAHCDEAGHEMENTHCIRTIHAEANAIVQSARHGVRLEDSEIFITASPCYDCFKLIANAGINKIYFGEFYREQRILDHAKELNIQLIDLSI
ncbi:MAG: dCMP deaminase family protein [Candidatus Marinimicrobia bacterium]|jgi:dCMP deaminase|nr:dCMP deaminase family protein [Candidatus Neomarinimicrobiota bacterium]MBT3948009.1 dCMP deaminase family protein [Candidatus Neomarinimicrobiota bacterium]MBT4064314.1 dCMP deaminase family protein [Candidatus Neomarinimicrobiota bacterium]MBT4308044.1 dCMP deaminase family protein [Candidatus Neomarinimicrobiota bacterium]MBT4452843.1 dCMP deaminase family protein [Candidatus Neomarinimicrobiota bacterium]|tara:strand:- start:656 stop:1081 length:426 start_codon:yes stop_codon:yes gene_type:complete